MKMRAEAYNQVPGHLRLEYGYGARVIRKRLFMGVLQQAMTEDDDVIEHSLRAIRNDQFLRK